MAQERYELTLYKDDPRIKQYGAPLSWDLTSTIRDNVASTRVLCAEILGEFFTIPDGVKEIIAVLNDRYTRGSYELRLNPNRDLPCSIHILIDGKPVSLPTYDFAEMKIHSFIERHGECFGSIEYEG